MPTNKTKCKTSGCFTYIKLVTWFHAYLDVSKYGNLRKYFCTLRIINAIMIDIIMVCSHTIVDNNTISVYQLGHNAIEHCLMNEFDIVFLIKFKTPTEMCFCERNVWYISSTWFFFFFWAFQLSRMTNLIYNLYSIDENILFFFFLTDTFYYQAHSFRVIIILTSKHRSVDVIFLWDPCSFVLSV